LLVQAPALRVAASNNAAAMNGRRWLVICSWQCKPGPALERSSRSVTHTAYGPQRPTEAWS
jgi:hypothetical protein